MSKKQENDKAIDYIVRNPIGIGGVEQWVSVHGYDAAKGQRPPRIVGRGALITIHPGNDELIDRWTRTKCIEVYKPSKHKHLVVAPVIKKPVERAKQDSGDDEADMTEPDQSSPIGGFEVDEDLDKETPPHEQSDNIAV